MSFLVLRKKMNWSYTLIIVIVVFLFGWAVVHILKKGKKVGVDKCTACEDPKGPCPAGCTCSWCQQKASSPGQ